MSIKAVIMDIDGTLINKQGQIMPKTKKTLMKAQSLGIQLVLASGRPTTGLLDLAEELEMEKHHGLLVSFNGSRVVDCETMEILFNKTMSVEEGQAVLEHMKQFKVIPMIDKGEHMIVNDVYNCQIRHKDQELNIIQYESRGNKYLLHEEKDMAAFADYPLNKILVAADTDYLSDHYQAMMEPFKDKLSCMFTAPFYFEFTAKGIDKAKALDSVLKPLGIEQSEMIAFGDAQNDASMIRYAGIGVAMGNAVDELKEMADEITLSNEEDGIAESLMKHIPELNEK